MPRPPYTRYNAGTRMCLYGVPVPTRPRRTSPRPPDSDVFYLGVDPGASGGYALLDPDGGVVETGGLPPEPADLLALFARLTGSDLFGDRRVVRAAMEQVGGYVGGGGQPGSAMFNFGRGYGRLEACLWASVPDPEANLTLVVPRVWQAAYSLTRKRTGRKVEDKGAWKNRLRARAEREFPDTKVTLKVADALLIANWNRMEWEEN